MIAFLGWCAYFEMIFGGALSRKILLVGLSPSAIRPLDALHAMHLRWIVALLSAISRYARRLALSRKILRLYWSAGRPIAIGDTAFGGRYSRCEYAAAFFLKIKFDG